MERIDVTGIIGNAANVFLACEGGNVAFAIHEPAVYETHVNFLEGYRGEYALIATLAAVEWMFLSTDCLRLISRIPKRNHGATWLVKKTGAVCECERKNVWPLSKDKFDDLRYFYLDYDQWAKTRKEQLDAIGRAYHWEIDQEFARHKALRSIIFEDAEFPYAGAFVEMVRRGQPMKAVGMYNRFARFAQFPLLSLVAQDPLLFNIGDAIVQYSDEKFKVIKTFGNTTVCH